MFNLFIFVALILSCCIRPLIAIDIQCGNKVVNTIIVDQTGLGKFRTVQSAIDSVIEGNSQWVKIKVNRGFYFEKVTIPLMKPCIVLEGEGQRVTTISYNSHQATDVSSTFISKPSNVVVRNITFQNSYYNRANFRVTPNDINFAIKPAVAVTVYGDKSAFYNCGFLGLQDTLWDSTGRHYFKNCYIEGAMDFIFGDGQSIYEDCNINARAGAHSGEVKFGYITAQARATERDRSGFVFIRGSVWGTTPVYLGRAYGPYSRVIFINTQFSSVVIPEGWNSWRFPGHESKFTYAEVDCSGPGSDTSRRVPWIEKFTRFAIKIRFSISSFIDQDAWISKIPPPF